MKTQTVDPGCYISWVLLRVLFITQQTLAALKKHYPARFTLFNSPPRYAFCMHLYGEAGAAA